MKRWYIPSLVARVLLLVVGWWVTDQYGCSAHSWTTTDSWHRPPPTVVPERVNLAFTEVHTAARDAAVRRLENASFVPLTPKEAAEYVDVVPPIDSGTRLYLVRGVVLNRGTGRFTVSFDGGNLYVIHGSLGRHAVPMQRQPVVVALPAEPKNVFVLCNMAE